MAEIPAGTLTKLRTTPHRSKMYLAIQQAIYWNGANWSGYLWEGQIDGDPAGTAGDLVADLTVDNGAVGDAKWIAAGAPNVACLDGMTVFIGTVKGDHDKGIFRLRGDQTLDAATVSLDIGSTSEIVDIVEDDDWVVVLDEFRLWTRYPRITEAGGVISWYKDYDITYNSLGADQATRQEASLPPTTMMGPHAVKFVDADEVVTVDFDWSDSYANHPDATVNAWASEGKRGETSGAWNSAAQDPAAQSYDGDDADADNDISGLAGFRVTLELGTDVQDAPVQFRRGVRYVFTLRRPGTSVAGVDPPNAEPITDFEVSPMEGDFEQGHWRTSVTVYDSQCNEKQVIEGSVVILFADDWYGSEQVSIGPVDDRENIVMIGRIADGSVEHNPETGTTSFEVVSTAGQAMNRETYPVPIEYNDDADEWYECPGLTTTRAVWHYVLWHSTWPLICDWNKPLDAYIAAMDFLAGDLYSTIDSFYRDRWFARCLANRYDMVTNKQNRQITTGAGIPTALTLQAGDWVDQLTFREVNETQCSIVELGGLNYDAGLIIPWMSKAPGTVNRNEGKSVSMMNLAVVSQATMNVWSGNWLAAQNNRYVDFVIPFAGNWRWFDIFPQDFIVVNQTVDRHTFSGDKFIVRHVSHEYQPQDGTIFSTVTCEAFTQGVAGQTIDIPEEIPLRAIPRIPLYPPADPGEPTQDLGRRIIASDVGVFATDNIGAANPIWYATNSGLSTARELDVYSISRDPFHWWTSGGTERTLWAGTGRGIFKMENWPYGTWSEIISMADIVAATGLAAPGANDYLLYCDMDMSIESDGEFTFGFIPSWIAAWEYWACCCAAGAINNATQLQVYAGAGKMGRGAVRYAQHGAADKVYVAISEGPQNVVDSTVYLYRTTTGGVAWNLISSLNDYGRTGWYASVSVPYVDANNGNDVYVLYGSGEGGIGVSRGTYFVSSDQGASFTEIFGGFGKVGLDAAGISGPQYLWLRGGQSDVDLCRYSLNGGITWIDLPATPTAVDAMASWDLWQGGTLFSALLGGTPTAGAPGNIIMYRWEQGMNTWADKTGNLEGFGLGECRDIERDSMGYA